MPIIFSGGITFGGYNLSPLSFVSQPQSKNVDEYSLATFSCAVVGGVAPYSFQYKKNGVNVGTNSATLSFTAAATDKNASVVVTVTDSAGTSITSTVAVLGVTSYIYQLDGLTQYVQLSSNIPFKEFNEFKCRVKFPTFSTGQHVIFNGNAKLRILNGTWDFPNGTLYIDGVIKGKGSAAQTDGAVRELRFVAGSSWGSSGFISTIGTDGGSYLSGSISKVIVGSGYSIPLGNKSQGANQLATIGSVNATIINYNASGWVAI
jgi:hypothetical protein